MKIGYFIPFKETYTVEEITELVIYHIITNYNILLEIISDRDKLFILKF